MRNLLVSLAFLVAIVGGQYFLLVWYEHRQKNGWRLVAEGVFEKASVISAPVSIKGFTNYLMTMVNIVTIFFQDGTTCKAVGVFDELPESGTAIRVYKNGLAEFRLERV